MQIMTAFDVAKM